MKALATLNYLVNATLTYLPRRQIFQEISYVGIDWVQQFPVAHYY